MIPEDLIERAECVGAMINVKDAERDLLRWPELQDQIIDDLVQAIQAIERHELSLCPDCGELWTM